MPQSTTNTNHAVWATPIGAGLGVFIYQAYFHGFKTAFAIGPLTILITFLILSIYQRSKATQRSA